MSRLLLLASPELRGPDVLALQHALARLGYAPGKQDGIYGPATAAAVRRFERTHKLAVDGEAGPHVFAALERKPLHHVPPAPKSTPGSQAATWLEKHHGMREKPAGSNHVPFTVEFGIGNVPWCAIAVSLAFKHGAGIVLGGAGAWAWYTGRGFAYVPALAAWAMHRGYWHGRTACRRGDIAVYGFGHSYGVHTGITTDPMEGGRFTAIEGNTAVGNDSNGGQVMYRLRYASEVLGFIRIPKGARAH